MLSIRIPEKEGSSLSEQNEITKKLFLEYNIILSNNRSR